jgi:hypothetical protein
MALIYGARSTPYGRAQTMIGTRVENILQWTSLRNTAGPSALLRGYVERKVGFVKEAEQPVTVPVATEYGPVEGLPGTQT